MSKACWLVLWTEKTLQSSMYEGLEKINLSRRIIGLITRLGCSFTSTEQVNWLATDSCTCPCLLHLILYFPCLGAIKYSFLKCSLPSPARTWQQPVAVSTLASCNFMPPFPVPYGKHEHLNRNHSQGVTPLYWSFEPALLTPTWQTWMFEGQTWSGWISYMWNATTDPDYRQLAF